MDILEELKSKCLAAIRVTHKHAEEAKVNPLVPIEEFELFKKYTEGHIEAFKLVLEFLSANGIN